MVTDPQSQYTSPAGKEFTLTAGRFASIHPASTILDMGCGYGEGVYTMVSEFRCKAVAVDIRQESVISAREYAEKKRVSHLIEFICADILTCDFPGKVFDLVLGEGGILSMVGRKSGLSYVNKKLVNRGWFAFSDLILLCRDVPSEILAIFDNESYFYETEESYRTLIQEAGFEIQFLCLVPPSGWDNYYAHIARRLEDDTGFFSDSKVKLAFHREIDLFYRFEGYRYIGYMVCIARKKK